MQALENDRQTGKVRKFYEKWPYHQDPPTEDLSSRLMQLEADWQNWVTPVTLQAKRTMDAGCGCGFNLALHARRASVAVGVDLSLSALKRARDYCSENDLQENLFLIRGDLGELDLPDRSFDLITCVGVLHHIPDHLKVLRNLSRLLDHKGILLLGIYHPGGRYWHRLKRKLLLSWWTGSDQQRIKWARRLFPVKKEARKYQIPEDVYVRDSYAAPVEKAFSVDYLQNTLKQVGLTLQEVRPSPRRAFRKEVQDLARQLSEPGGRTFQLDSKRVDAELRRLKQHHYWCLARK